MLNTISDLCLLAAQAPAHPAPWWSTLTGWSGLGSAVGGFSTAVLAVTAFIGGAAALKPWRANLRAQKALAQEQENGIRLDRMRRLHGWSRNGVAVYGVTLVMDPEELGHAREELIAGGPTEYVVLRVSENPSGNVNRAHSLRQLIEAGGYVARPPTAGEYEALEAGIRVLTSP